MEADTSSLSIPEHIQLGEIQFFKPGPIKMLLGAEYFWELAGNCTIYLGKSSQVHTTQQTCIFSWVKYNSLNQDQYKCFLELNISGNWKAMVQFI
jgi:hypothetical protein